MAFTPRQYFSIASRGGTLTNIETLTTSAPNMAPTPKYFTYPAVAQLLNGGQASLGSPFITWTWGYIYADMYTALRVICPGPSSLVDIRSRVESAAETTSGGYTYYHATMLWPALDSVEFRAGLWGFPFVLTFRNLESYTP